MKTDLKLHSYIFPTVKHHFKHLQQNHNKINNNSAMKSVICNVYSSVAIVTSLAGS